MRLHLALRSSFRSLRILSPRVYQGNSLNRGFLRGCSSASHTMKPKDNLSEVSGPTEPPLIEETIGELLDIRVEESPDVLALISEQENVKWSYSQLGEEVDHLVTGLTKLGIRRGDRVGVYMPNIAAWVVFQYALAKIGAILVSLNPGYREQELSQVIKLVKLKALVAVPRYKKSDYVEIIGNIIPEIHQSEINSKEFPSLSSVIFASAGEHKIPLGSIDMRDLMKEKGRHEVEKLACTDIINIQFTSGTTGTPKGVSLTHENILNNGRFVGERQNLTVGDVVCIPVPLYHCFGIVMGNLACLTKCATALFPSPTFEPEMSLAAVEKHRAVALYGVPTMFVAMLQHERFKRTDLSSLRTGIMAGSPCPVPIMEKVTKFMPDVTVCYGMTETSPVSFQTLPTSPSEARTSTVGQIMPHTQGRVLDGDKIAPVGKTGRLQVKGYLVMRGYWENSKDTNEAIDSDDWMETGDLASIDSSGYCRIVGRLKDLVIRGGENLYPPEIESWLLRHPCIKDVSVVGVPDDKFGEELCAFYTRSDHPLPEHPLREEFKGKIAHFKIPKYFIPIDEFPTTVTGKIMKYKLREMAIETLNQS